jgi:ribosome recycling factor
MVKDLINAAAPKLDKALEHLEIEIGSLRTGRANVSLVDGITIEVYGQTMPLKQVATISTPDARTISVTPWDRGNLSTIEKAIRESQSLGLNPSNDGAIIRLNIPPMTEERRKEIVKQLGVKVEECHIALRNIRHDVLGEVKKLEKAKEATQDDAKFAENELNKKLDQYKAKIETIAKTKEQEILAV